MESQERQVAAISGDGRRLVRTSRECPDRFELYDLERDVTLLDFRTELAEPSRIAVDHLGQRALICSPVGTAVLVDLDEGRSLGNYSTAMKQPDHIMPCPLAISLCGSKIAVGVDGMVEVWDTRRDRCMLRSSPADEMIRWGSDVLPRTLKGRLSRIAFDVSRALGQRLFRDPYRLDRMTSAWFHYPQSLYRRQLTHLEFSDCNQYLFLSLDDASKHLMVKDLRSGRNKADSWGGYQEEYHAHGKIVKAAGGPYSAVGHYPWGHPFTPRRVKDRNLLISASTPCDVTVVSFSSLQPLSLLFLVHLEQKGEFALAAGLLGDTAIVYSTLGRLHRTELR